MPWEIPKKICLLAVAILFLFTFFNLILDALRTYVKSTYTLVDTSVVDRNIVASDPGPTFRFDTDLDPDPTPSFTYVQKS